MTDAMVKAQHLTNNPLTLQYGNSHLITRSNLGLDRCCNLIDGRVSAPWLVHHLGYLKSVTQARYQNHHLTPQYRGHTFAVGQHTQTHKSAMSYR